MSATITAIKIDWNPIESAPMDGTEVLVYSHGMVLTARWESEFQSPYWNYDLDELSPSVHSCTPTHWLPLPEPPAKSSLVRSTANNDDAKR